MVDVALASAKCAPPAATAEPPDPLSQGSQWEELLPGALLAVPREGPASNSPTRAFGQLLLHGSGAAYGHVEVRLQLQAEAGDEAHTPSFTYKAKAERRGRFGTSPGSDVTLKLIADDRVNLTVFARGRFENRESSAWVGVQVADATLVQKHGPLQPLDRLDVSYHGGGKCLLRGWRAPHASVDGERCEMELHLFLQGPTGGREAVTLPLLAKLYASPADMGRGTLLAAACYSFERDSLGKLQLEACDIEDVDALLAHLTSQL